MTAPFVQAAISIGGIALTVFAAWGLGFRRDPVFASPADAERAAADGLPGFRPAAAELAPDGRGATVRGIDGRVAVVTPLGDRWVVRLSA